MQVNIEIDFGQLVNIVKKLPPKQLDQLKVEIDSARANGKQEEDMLDFLLRAPVFSEAQIEEIAQNRKNINEWRKKQ